jgi:hypothetical protein
MIDRLFEAPGFADAWSYRKHGDEDPPSFTREQPRRNPPIGGGRWVTAK